MLAGVDAVLTKELLTAKMDPATKVENGKTVVKALQDLVRLTKGRKATEANMLESRLMANSQESALLNETMVAKQQKINEAVAVNAEVTGSVAPLREKVAGSVAAINKANHALIAVRDLLRRANLKKKALRMSVSKLTGEYDSLLANMQAEKSLGDFIRDLIGEKLRQVKRIINADPDAPSMDGVQDLRKVEKFQQKGAELLIAQEAAMAAKDAAMAKVKALQESGASAEEIAASQKEVDRAEAATGALKKEASKIKTDEAKAAPSVESLEAKVLAATQDRADAVIEKKGVEALLIKNKELMNSGKAKDMDTVKSSSARLEGDLTNCVEKLAKVDKKLAAAKALLKTAKTKAVANYAIKSMEGKVAAESELEELQKRLDAAMAAKNTALVTELQEKIPATKAKIASAQKKADGFDGRFPNRGTHEARDLAVAPVAEDEEPKCGDMEFQCKNAGNMATCGASAADCEAFNKEKAAQELKNNKSTSGEEDHATKCSMETAWNWCETKPALRKICKISVDRCKKLIQVRSCDWRGCGLRCTNGGGVLGGRLGCRLGC